ncbi:MAG TPA: ActS/PrrB/RegB family redox-sensitive histidine kinase [Caulobacteraceae bacterium]|jgi:two-component system sensor histidine kinase RegB
MTILASPDTAARLDRTSPAPWQGGGAPGERLRLRTLVGLRWSAVGGQMLALLAARFLLGFDVPLLACLGVITLAVLFNLALVLALPPQRVLRQWEAALQLGFDILQLGLLLLLTGGVGNPFTVLLVVPVILGASSLEGRHPFVLTGLACAVVVLLAAMAETLPWLGGTPLILPPLYHWAAALAVIVGIVVASTYARRAAAESARMELALHAAETVLAREQRLSALGGLAAMAAHELGTPLATIAVVAKEMARECPPGPLREDAELVSSQARRCRDILSRLAETPETDDVAHARISLAQLLEEAAGPEEPDEEVRVEWSVIGPPDTDPPDLIRHPEVGPAMTSFIENAMDFAKSEVRLVGRYDDDFVAVEIQDDGPGFAPEIFAKLGEPYVTSRPSGEHSPSGHLGMGLGFFIAKTLLERTGAEVGFRNARGGGAVVSIRWPRGVIEALAD